jgi:adenylylsulfate kinase
MEREANRTDNLVISGLYKKAIERQHGGESATEGLGQMVGVDVPYEEPTTPELVIDSNSTTPKDASVIIIVKLILK